MPSLASPQQRGIFFAGRLSCFSLDSCVMVSGHGVPVRCSAKKNTLSSWPLNAHVVSKLARIRCPALPVHARMGTDRKEYRPN